MGLASASRRGVALAVALCLLAAARAQRGGFVPPQQGQQQNGGFFQPQTLPPYYNPNPQLYPVYNPNDIIRNSNARHQDFTPHGCSQSDGSPAAIEACINAVRENPIFYQAAALCDLTKYTPAPPLNLDFSLRSVAAAHVQDMAARHRLTHSGYAERIRATGFQGGTYVNENIAFTDGSSALHTVMRWMCSSRDAKVVMDCGFQYFGSARICPSGNPQAGCFYSVDFGGNGAATCPQRIPNGFGGFYFADAPPASPPSD